MKIGQVQEVRDSFDRAVGFFSGLDPMMRTGFLEGSLVDGVNRSICGVLGASAGSGSTLRTIRDVEMVAGRLGALVEEGGGLNEVEELLVEVMGIREEVSFESEEVMRNWGRSRKYRLRIRSIFKYMKMNIGKFISLDDLRYEILELDDRRGVKRVKNYKRIVIKILRNMMVRSEYHQYESGYLCHYAVEEVKENGKIQGYVMRKARKEVNGYG